MGKEGRLYLDVAEGTEIPVGGKKGRLYLDVAERLRFQ